MRTALALIAYAIVVAWCLPAPLGRLTSRGISARLGLGAWLAAMMSALVSAGLAFYFFSRTPQANFPLLTRLLCREVAGNACTPQVYRSELYQLGVAAVLVLVAAGALVAAWRWGHRVQRSRRRTLAHGRMARLVGRPLVARGSAGTGAVVLEDPRPAAYCAAGTIVVTRGALDILDEAQLAVVLAHEQGHLRGRHHVLYLVTRGLSAAFPGVPLFGAGERAVARLTEMSADDAAIRASGGTAGGTSSRNAADARGGTGFTVRATLVSALVALATGEAAPGSAGPGKGAGPGEALIPRTALAAASYAVQARVERMLAAPTRRAAVSHAAALAALTLALAAVPAAFLALAA